MVDKQTEAILTAQDSRKQIFPLNNPLHHRRTKMLQRDLLAGMGLALLLGWSPLLAAPANVITQQVGVCDPNFPNLCIAPDASGNVPVTSRFTPLTPGQYGLAITTSTALTIPTGAVQAVVCASGNSVNYTYDGTTAPTASVGMPLSSGQCIQFSGATVLANLRFIQTAATATLNVSYTK